MKALKAVLFDLDGTLLDTAPDFVITVNQLLHRHGKPSIAPELIRKSVSQGARALVTLAFSLKEGEAGFEDLRQQLLDTYEQNLSRESSLFPGIFELLQMLEQRGIAWGIATNKPERFTTPLMAATQLPCQPAAVICPDHVTQPKPHPESLYLACKKIGCQPGEAIYIGDHLRDIECGINAGMNTIAAAYGYIAELDNPTDWKATHLAKQPEELWAIISSRLNTNHPSAKP